MAELAQLGWTADQVNGVLLVYLRLQALILTLPGFGARFLPARIKVALAMALTPLFQGQAVAADNPAGLAVLAATAVVTGAVMGLMVRVIAMALDTATAAIAQSASLSQIIGVADESSPHPIGNLFHLAGTALLMALGLPMVLCRLASDSFRAFPPGAWPDIGQLWPQMLGLVAHSFLLAMGLAAPFILGGLLFQGLSGIVARVMPALPVVFVVAPLMILIALGALIVVSPAILSLWSDSVLSGAEALP